MTEDLLCSRTSLPLQVWTIPSIPKGAVPHNGWISQVPNQHSLTESLCGEQHWDSPQDLFIHPTLRHQCKTRFLPSLNYSFHPHLNGELSAMRLLYHSRNAKGIARVNLSLLLAANITFHVWRIAGKLKPDASKPCTRIQLPSCAVNFLYQSQSFQWFSSFMEILPKYPSF